MIAFHKGLVKELQRRCQMAGVKLEEHDAQLALAGLLTREVDARGKPISSNDNQKAMRSDAAKWVESAVADILKDDKRFEIMRLWESEHPDQDPFPISFPKKVLGLLEFAEEEDIPDRIKEVINLAKEEMMLW